MGVSLNSGIATTANAESVPMGRGGDGVTVERLLLHLKHSHLLPTGTWAFWILRTWVLMPSGCRQRRAQKLNLFSLPLYASWISSGF